MGRFESPLQVVGLFLAASIVSVGVIFFINAEAHSRQSHNQHQLPEPSPLVADLDGSSKNEVGDEKHRVTVGEQKGISRDVSLSSSAELTSSNYTSGSKSAGLEADPIRSPTSNVTLLNFFEDGLEKLLVLIKQAKRTYKSYYLSEGKLSQQAGADSSNITSTVDCHPIKIKDNDTSPEKDGEEEATARLRIGTRSARRRKKRAAAPSVPLAGTVVKRLKRATVLSPSGTGKRGRIGENEPYYWQMLEDNNRESTHHHHKKEKESAPQQRSSDSSNTKKELYYSHQQNQNHHHSYHHHQQQQQQPQHHNQFGGGPENNHYIYPVGVPGAAPAVASAFTSGSGDNSPNLQLQHGGGLSSHHSSTSDFHKIRHAMNKLGGGGLDISVVERMILDTKSSGRGHPSQGGGGQNQQNHFTGHANFNPSGGQRSKDLSSNQHHNNHIYAKSPSSVSNEVSQLTTATTKTTHSGRQDESLYVNQLRHQQQQLAQSLLPPTVTWLSGEGGSGSGDSTKFLPLPSSSLATGSKQERRRENDVREEDDDDDDFNEERQVTDNDNRDDSKENLVGASASPTSTRKKNKHERQQQRRRNKMKRKKGKRKNNELSYSSSSKEVQEVERRRPQEGDYPLPFTRGDEDTDDEEENNNNINANGNGGIVDGEDGGADPLMGEEDDDDDEDNDNDKDGEGLLFSNGIEEDEDDDVDNDDDEEEPNNGNHEEKRRNEGDSQYSHPPSTEHDGKTCYRTDDVLIVVAITCCLNFAFVLVIWALVRWFSISSNPKEKDFQNLGDCDDTLDPTVVFHGVTEDPCWTLATKEAGISGSSGSTGIGGGAGVNTGMTLRSTASTAGGGTIGSRGHYERGEIGGYMGTLGSVHSGNKVDLFPIMGKHGGSALTNTIGAAVMTMTMERSRGGEGRGGVGGGGTGIYGHTGGGGSSSLMLNGSGAGLYSFRPEHVPVHHGSSGQMHRSYSQSMEDLRFIQ